MPNSDDIEFLVDSVDIDRIDDASDINDDLEDDQEETDDGLDDLVDEYAAEEERDLVSEALLPGRPLLMLHRGAQLASTLVAAAKNISYRHSGAIGLGVIASMPRMSPSNLRTFLTRDDLPPVRIADPEGFARLDSFGSVLASQREKEYVGPSTSKYWSYLTDPLPAGGTRSWVEEVLDHQQDAGATLSLTPGSWVDSSAPISSVEAIRRHAEWARAYVGPSANLAVNMTLSANWLTSSHLRDRLLNEIVDMDEEVFYVRVRWPLLPQPYGQLLDPDLLDGYAEISNVFADNDKVLLLPNTGLTGMISLAWGAHGFSTGIGSGERAFADTKVIRMKQRPRPNPAERIFAPSIMHVVERSTSTLLDTLPGAQQCGCTFCRRMARLPNGFSKELACAHYLRRVSDFTADIAAGARGTRAAARAIVREASRFANSASTSVALDGSNDPRHLRLWADRLR